MKVQVPGFVLAERMCEMLSELPTDDQVWLVIDGHFDTVFVLM